jgi:hypothetical protein
MCVIRFGYDDVEFLAITLLGRAHPDCTDYWDGNWLRAKVELVAGGFRGVVRGDLRTDELARFHAELLSLDESLHGAAEFATMEGWLTIDIRGNGRGRIDLDCELKDEPGIGNTLICRLTHDQSFLRPMLAQLGQGLRDYPILGHRPV